VWTPAQAFAAECPPTGNSQAPNSQAENSLAATWPVEGSRAETSQTENSVAATSQAQSSPVVNLEPINSLTITQTSVMQGLAPGVAPVPITGIVANISDDSTVITAIAVEITGVITAPGAAPGVCDASDYVLLNSLMPVGRTLGPGGWTEFAGASIGFNNKSTNQDTCQGATIELLYTANPS
jgi:hypothetical protein